MTKNIIASILILFSFGSYAHVGLTKLEFQDQLRDRVISTYIFYPTNELPAKRFAENMVFVGFDAAEGSKVSKEKLPLYILVHGTSGNWKNTSWLAKELAEDAIVVSANFPGYTTGQATPETVLKPWDQAKDVSYIIEKVLSGSFGKYIDESRVVVIGHSLGGYTAMALAGVVIDLSNYYEFCKVNHDKSCTYFGGALNNMSQVDIETARQSLYNKKVRAGIALAPGFTESMLRYSLMNSKTPMFVISAENDMNVPLKTHFPDIPENIAHHQIKGAAHFSFLQLCKPNANAILSEEGAEFVCYDGGDRSRAEIHKETIQQIERFISKYGL